MKLISLLFILLTGCEIDAQKPRDGIYTYTILWEEWGTKSLGATCLIKINGDSIEVIHDGNKTMTGTKGDILDKGIIIKHKKTGKWIIGHSIEDEYSDEIGGCGSGPTIIDFKRKTWLSC